MVNSTELSDRLTIPGLSHPTILQYFETFNAGEYQQTAALFTTTGALYPPFEAPIQGQGAIAQYLETEALGMQIYPHQGLIEAQAEGNLNAQVTGQVQTPWFAVHVSWQFLLNPQQEILSVTLKLLASPQELLKLRR